MWPISVACCHSEFVEYWKKPSSGAVLDSYWSHAIARCHAWRLRERTPLTNAASVWVRKNRKLVKDDFFLTATQNQYIVLRYTVKR